MPKRSAEEKLARYHRKIRKLHEEENKRQRIRRTLDSSDDENIKDAFIDEPQSVRSDTEPDDQQSPQKIPPTIQAPMSEEAQANAATAIETPTESSLDPVLLSALGASISDTPDFGEPVHISLANLWTPLLKKGLSTEDKSNLMKEYLIPSNCKLLQPPKLNAEISAAVSETVRHRDKKLESFQQAVGVGTAAINRGMDLMLRSEDKARALKSLSDGCRILSDLHHLFTHDRIKLIMPSLEKNFLHIIQDTERDETLFGNTLGEKIKASKAIEKQGQQIRKGSNQKTSVPSAQTSSAPRSTHQGNGTGPPRYLSFRGGRGGQRKPRPAARRSYSTFTTTQAPSKNSNQARLRAQAQ